MEIKRTTEILVETERRFVVRQTPSSERLFCPVCGEPMVSAEQAASFFETNCRRIYRLIETGAAHFVELESGAAAVCLASLAEISDGKILPGKTA